VINWLQKQYRLLRLRWLMYQLVKASKEREEIKRLDRARQQFMFDEMSDKYDDPQYDD
jgi:hypothetical protein